MGGIIISKLSECPPTVFRLPWPPDITVNDVAAEILGDPYSKKSPLPSIGNFSRLAYSPKLYSYRVLGQARIQ
jgi:hypothetical protein